MLRILDSHRRLGRREVLRIGGCGLAGGLLSGGPFSGGLRPQSAAAAAEATSLLTGKSVVFLFMQGGPSQIETFDPKMSAPTGIHSATGEVATTIPGVTFGGTFPRLAGLAERLTVVRSYTTGDGNHDIKPVVGRHTFGANLGSLYSRVAGTNHPDTGMPTNAALFPQAVHAESKAQLDGFGRFDSTGGLGRGYAPFAPGAGGDMQADMQLTLPVERLGERRALLDCFDRANWRLDAAAGTGAIDDVRQQAFRTILGGVAKAFDLTQEDARTLERYDTAPLVRPDQISRAWNNYDFYVDHARTLGRLLLLARRLCEAGCRFVTVNTSFVWDMHADVNNAGVEEGMRYMGVPFDHAVSAFIEDCAARGLSDEILLVCSGEMGRTPRINDRGGRDHWGGLAPLLLSGGGLKMGQVIGQSTRDAGVPLTEPIQIPNLIATVLGTMLDISRLRITAGVPDDVVRAATAAEPIPGLG